MSVDISEIQDYAALKKLAAALWKQDNGYSGAAIMIGSGFSRAAADTADKKKVLPLWNDLATDLVSETKSQNANDPMRVAEEYKALFGAQALTDFIKCKIQDEAWVPGALYKKLLELEWAEVLTTNWDTLLERASVEIHRPVYSIVSRQTDLSSARSPRIVKLHGTVNVTEDLIFTQEDYRKYPSKYAAFVNFTRQVFIENELCLLGFSGDDPNFLQWAGWVRDQLECHSRRIYLVGALELTAAKRRYLESINVSPIDLSALVAEFDSVDSKHRHAAELFLSALHDLKPKNEWDWKPTDTHRKFVDNEEVDRVYKDFKYSAKLLVERLPIFESDRKSYPNWLVCNAHERWLLSNQINDPWPTKDILAAMPITERDRLLYEICWRHRVSFEVIPFWLVSYFLEICDPEKPSSGIKKQQQLEICLVLFQNSRWFDKSESDNVSKATLDILEKNLKFWPEVLNEIEYHKGILARDNFDYTALEKLIDNITPNEPLWKMRKASLLSELGRFEEAKNLIGEAHKELLSQYRKDRNSIEIFSKLAWSHWIIRGVDMLSTDVDFKPFPSDYQDVKCSPWDHIDGLQNKISEALDKQRENEGVQPEFEPGRYKDSSQDVTLSNALHPLTDLYGISNTVGMPFSWDGIGFLNDHAKKIAKYDLIDDSSRFSLAIRSSTYESSDVIKHVFSRIRVACYTSEDLEVLMNSCVNAIHFWVSKLASVSDISRKHTITRLRVFIEILARIAIRAKPERAIEYFRLAVTLGKNPECQHIWLYDAISHLLEYSLKAIPESQHAEILLDALSFPLDIEMKIERFPKWPNPIITTPGERTHNVQVDARISEIIDCISSCSVNSSSALLRLLPLMERKYLTSEECRRIEVSVWGDNPDWKVMPETGLYSFALLKLTSSNTENVKTLLKEKFFNEESDSLFSQFFLEEIGNLALAKDVNLLPDYDQANQYFDKLVSWRPKLDGNDSFGYRANEYKRIGEGVGRVLARSIVPALDQNTLSENYYSRIVQFDQDVDAPETVIAFPYFADKYPHLSVEIEKTIRQGLQSQKEQRVAYSAYAILKWTDLAGVECTDRLIARLVHLVGSGRAVGLTSLIWTAKEMLNKGYLKDEHVTSLAEALPLIFDNSDYKNFLKYKKESVTVSLIRSECVKLARSILSIRNEDSELKRILVEAANDALPEVRYA